MASSVQLGYALWQDGMTFNGQLGRNLEVAAGYATGGTATSLTVQSGCISSVGSMKVAPVSGLTIQVYAGFCVVANSTSNLQGAYVMGSMVANQLTVATADPTNPRIDLVCATVYDPGTSSGYSEVQIITGTPASSPTVPSLPANSLALAQVSVPANTTTISTGLLSDVRTYTGPAGGATPWSNVGASGPGFNGLIAYDAANDRFFHNNSVAGAGARMKTKPFAPVHITQGTSITLSTGSPVSIKSANFTCDGATDIKITFSYTGLYQSTPGIASIGWGFYLDSASQAMQSYIVATRDDVAGGTDSGGSTFVYYTSSNTGDTPSAGTHTLSLKASYSGSGSAPVIDANVSTNHIMYLRVEPVDW